MKTLSDYKGEEALELWADLLEPLTNIFSDSKVEKVIKQGKPPLIIAKTIIKHHANDAMAILERIDPTEIDGLSVVIRLVSIINEIGNNSEMKAFFGFAVEGTSNSTSGSATESTKAKKK